MKFIAVVVDSNKQESTKTVEANDVIEAIRKLNSEGFLIKVIDKEISETMFDTLINEIVEKGPMKRYICDCMDGKGQEAQKIIEAENQQEAINIVRKDGYFPIRVVDEAELQEHMKKSIQNSLRKEVKKRVSTNKNDTPIFIRVSNSELILFTRNCAALVGAGIPLVRVLHQLSKNEPNNGLKSIMARLSHSIQEGNTFSESLNLYPKVFNRMYVNMIRAGEASGCLDVIMNRLTDFLDKENNIKQIAWNSVICVSLTVIASLGAAAMSYVLFPLTIIIAAFIIWVLVNVFLTSAEYMAMYRSRSIATFSKCLGTMLSSGVPILQALYIVRDVSFDKDMKKACQDIHDNVKQGDTMVSGIKDNPHFSNIAVEMIDAGEETGALPDMLMKISDIYDAETEASLKKLNYRNNITVAVSVVMVMIMLAFIKH